MASGQIHAAESSTLTGIHTLPKCLDGSIVKINNVQLNHKVEEKSVFL